MIAVIVPVHNEEALLAGCLLAVVSTLRQHAAVSGDAVQGYVVLDACDDRSREIAAAFEVIVLECHHRSVGAARALGAEAAIAAGAEWLAFTDADTVVAPDWLSCQVALGSDAVCGTIGVDWPSGMERAQLDFELNYVDADDHRHIHGANFGLSTAAYVAVGGFTHRLCHEDVAMVKALLDAGRTIAWSAAPRVMTSARIEGRAPCGFAAALRSQIEVPIAAAIVAAAAPAIDEPVYRPLSPQQRLDHSFQFLEA